MNKLFFSVMVLFAFICFALAYFFLTDSGNKPRPEIIVHTVSTTGSLTWYTSNPQSHADRIVNAFKIKTGIDVKIVRGSSFIIKERLFTEIKNNSTKADVVTIADIGTFIELKNEGQLMKYASQHYQKIPEEFKETDYWAVLGGFGICMAYNKNRIDTPPQKWTDLLNERWKGRIGLEDINTAGSQYGQYYILREKLGVEFWKKLLSVQRPKIYYRTEKLADALLEGEIDIAGQFSIHTVYDYKAKRKTSIRGIYIEEGIPFIVNPVAIIKQTAHLKEAKIFFDFLLSREGQELMQCLNYKYSVREDISSLNGIPPLNNLNILLPKDKREYAEKRDEYILEFNNFFQGKE